MLCKIGEFAIKFNQSRGDTLLLSSPIAGQPSDLTGELLLEERYEVRRQQPALQDREDDFLHGRPPDGSAVLAGAALLVGDAPIVVPSGIHVGRSAPTALQQPAEEMLRPLRRSSDGACPRPEFVRDCPTDNVVDDPQVGKLDLDPVLRVSQPIAALTRVGVGVLPPFAAAPTPCGLHRAGC